MHRRIIALLVFALAAVISAFFLPNPSELFRAETGKSTSAPASHSRTASSQSPATTFTLFADFCRVDKSFVSTIHIKNLLVMDLTRVTEVSQCSA